MYVAIDTNCILPGRVGGIENYTLGLIEALKLKGSPADRLLLLTRPENHLLFNGYADAMTRVQRIDRPLRDGKPIDNWPDLLHRDPAGGKRALEDFQRQKADVLRRHDVQLVHFPGNTINPLDLDLPIVLNLHDLQHRHFPHYFSQAELEHREKWWSASARRADSLLAASGYVKDDLQTQLGISPEKIFVTPDVFQSAFFARPAETELATLRVRWALPKIFFLYPAAVWPHKNHARLIDAFIKANIPGAELILTGGGQSESSLPELIDSLGARQRIRLLGRVQTSELLALYHLAAALVFPSEHEAWSIPIMEAMACGCPVASSNVTSLPEEVGDGGLLFPPDDVPAMADAMKRLATDKILRQTLADRGRQRVAQFGPVSFLRTLQSAYENAIRAPRSRKAA